MSPEYARKVSGLSRNGPALQNKQIVVLRIAFRARKVLGTFEKQGPAPRGFSRATSGFSSRQRATFDLFLNVAYGLIFLHALHVLRFICKKSMLHTWRTGFAQLFSCSRQNRRELQKWRQ